MRIFEKNVEKQREEKNCTSTTRKKQHGQFDDQRERERERAHSNIWRIGEKHLTNAKRMCTKKKRNQEKKKCSREF